MEYHKIKNLVDRFWAGNCSDAEEDLLRSYFNNEGYLKEFQNTADYFKYLHKEKIKLSLNEDFDQKVLSQITVEKSSSGFGIFLKMAAGIALVLGLYLGYQAFTNQSPGEILVEDSFENPEEAYNEVKKALLLVSGKMNEGTAYGNELKKFSHANKRIRYENDIKQ